MNMPQTTIGILGSGQLGRMLVIAAAQLGIKSHVYGPDAANSPAGELAYANTTAAYNDHDALRAFGTKIVAVTSEFENVPSDTISYLANFCAVSPGAKALHIAQHRIREKSFARDHGIQTPNFWHVTDIQGLNFAMKELNGKGVLKTCQLGYDGKGQVWVDPTSDLEASFLALGSNDVILEAAVAFHSEVSFLLARAADGRSAHFPPTLNHHKNGVLMRSTGPADLSQALIDKGQKAVQELAESMDLVGLLALETFVTKDGQLLFNEIAPRPHNSFHWTIEGCATSQFTQLVRCLAGMPFGSTLSYGTWQMNNFLGENLDTIGGLAAEKNLHLHLYGKSVAKNGRKIGHTNRQISKN